MCYCQGSKGSYFCYFLKSIFAFCLWNFLSSVYQCRIPFQQNSWHCFQVNFGVISLSVPVGTYRMCYCQGSLRPCASASEFTVDVGAALVIESAKYIFPQKCESSFLRWRGPPWSTWNDCCCNFKVINWISKFVEFSAVVRVFEFSRQVRIMTKFKILGRLKKNRILGR